MLHEAREAGAQPADGIYFDPENEAVKRARGESWRRLLDFENPLATVPDLWETYSFIGSEGQSPFNRAIGEVVNPLYYIPLARAPKWVAGAVRNVVRPTPKPAASAPLLSAEATGVAMRRYSQYVELLKQAEDIQRLQAAGQPVAGNLERLEQTLKLSRFADEIKDIRESGVNRLISTIKKEIEAIGEMLGKEEPIRLLDDLYADSGFQPASSSVVTIWVDGKPMEIPAEAVTDAVAQFKVNGQDVSIEPPSVTIYVDGNPQQYSAESVDAAFADLIGLGHDVSRDAPPDEPSLEEKRSDIDAANELANDQGSGAFTPDDGDAVADTNDDSVEGDSLPFSPGNGGSTEDEDTTADDPVDDGSTEGASTPVMVTVWIDGDPTEVAEDRLAALVADLSGFGSEVSFDPPAQAEANAPASGTGGGSFAKADEPVTVTPATVVGENPRAFSTTDEEFLEAVESTGGVSVTPSAADALAEAEAEEERRAEEAARRRAARRKRERAEAREKRERAREAKRREDERYAAELADLEAEEERARQEEREKDKSYSAELADLEAVESMGVATAFSGATPSSGSSSAGAGTSGAQGVDFSPVYDDEIEFFKNGGIVTKPTIALLGEAGPEAVVPLTGKPRTTNLPGGGSVARQSDMITGWWKGPVGGAFRPFPVDEDTINLPERPKQDLEASPVQPIVEDSRLERRFRDEPTRRGRPTGVSIPVSDDRSVAYLEMKKLGGSWQRVGDRFVQFDHSDTAFTHSNTPNVGQRNIESQVQVSDQIVRSIPGESTAQASVSREARPRPPSAATRIQSSLPGTLRFPSAQAWQRMLPSERTGFRDSVEQQGVSWEDYVEAFQRTSMFSGSPTRRASFQPARVR